MNKEFTADSMKALTFHLLTGANQAVEVANNEKNDFNIGRRLAYYEVMDTINNELSVYDEETKNYGYPDDWESKLV